MGILFATLSVSCSPKYSVSGKITGVKNDTVYVLLKAKTPEKTNLNKDGFYDTLVLKHGKFGLNLDNGVFTEICLYPLGTGMKISKGGLIIGY